MNVLFPGTEEIQKVHAHVFAAIFGVDVEIESLSVFLKIRLDFEALETMLATKSIVQENQDIADGIYYIVLADLVSSTKFGAKWGNAALAARIHTFVEASKEALTNARMSSNSGRFLKSVGDGVLIAFNHFPDVVQWQMEFDAILSLIAIRHDPIQVRICVHAGELRFDVGDSLNLATNQVSKMEKKVGAGELVLSDIAHKLALPSLYPKQCAFKESGAVRLEGYARPVRLHRLVVKADMAFLIDKTARGQK